MGAPKVRSLDVKRRAETPIVNLYELLQSWGQIVIGDPDRKMILSMVGYCAYAWYDAGRGLWVLRAEGAVENELGIHPAYEAVNWFKKLEVS